MGTVWLGTLGLGLALMTAATPPRVQMPKAVCNPHGACVTLTEEGRTEEGLLILRLEEKLPARIPAKRAFGLWLAWPQEAQKQRQLVTRQEPFQVVLETPAGHFELFVPLEVLVRRTPEEPPALLAHVSFDPAHKGVLKAAVNEVVAAAQARGLLTPDQQQVLASRQKALEAGLPGLLRVMEEFLARPSNPKSREQFLFSLASFPGTYLSPDAPEIAPETFLTGPQRTALRKAGYEVVGKHSLKYSETAELAYQLRLQAYSVEQLVREWNAGLRGPAAGIENLPRPPLDFDRAHRLDDVSFTLDVRNDTGLTRMEQVLQRLLEVPGVRRGSGAPLPPAR